MKPFKEKLKKGNRLRLFNNALTIIVVGFSLYIIFAPFLPQATWWVREDSPLQRWTSSIQSVEASADEKIIDNRLFIPAIGLSELIHDGGLEQLKKGVLRRGLTSTPDKGGNTVLVGHRFTYDDRGVFYHLDKVKVGDKIAMHWNGVRYDYTVARVFVVAPEHVEIEDNTDTEMLTIYTCTPLWSAKDRLVIQAERNTVL